MLNRVMIIFVCSVQCNESTWHYLERQPPVVFEIWILVNRFLGNFADLVKTVKMVLSIIYVPQLHSPNRYFVEIGAADGLEEIILAWLAIAKKYSGLMIEGDPVLASRIEKNVASFNLGVQAQAAFVTADNVKDILEGSFTPIRMFFPLILMAMIII